MCIPFAPIWHTHYARIQSINHWKKEYGDALFGHMHTPWQLTGNICLQRLHKSPCQRAGLRLRMDSSAHTTGIQRQRKCSGNGQQQPHQLEILQPCNGTWIRVHLDVMGSAKMVPAACVRCCKWAKLLSEAAIFPPQNLAAAVQQSVSVQSLCVSGSKLDSRDQSGCGEMCAHLPGPVYISAAYKAGLLLCT